MPCPHRSCVPRARGFSLIELLVVIVIIAVLAGILLPAIRLAKDGALLMRCATNLRQISVFIFQFENDNEGLMPGAGQGASGSASWLDILATEVANDEKVKVLRLGNAPGNNLNCPAWITVPNDTRRSMRYNANAGGGTNDWVNKTSQYGKVFDPPTSKSPLYAGWQFYCLGAPHSRFGAQPTKVLIQETSSFGDNCVNNGTVDFRHRNGMSANFVFFDGHTETAVKGSPTLNGYGYGF